MTRSIVSNNSPKAQKKTFRAQAKQQGMTFRGALEARAKALEGQKVPSQPGLGRRNPGRMDGMQWNGDSFISPGQVDLDDNASIIESEFDDGDEDSTELEHEFEPKGPVAVCLIDIARPAKAKGVAKEFAEFEVVGSLRHVIALDDAEERAFGMWVNEEDEWEQLFGEGEAKKSYAAALSNGGG